jgi:hypothetical protein
MMGELQAFARHRTPCERNLGDRRRAKGETEILMGEIDLKARLDVAEKNLHRKLVFRCPLVAVVPFKISRVCCRSRPKRVAKVNVSALS